MSETGHLDERLSAYMDDELGAADRTAVEAHLSECAACARRLEELLAVEGAARMLPAPAPEGYFEAFPARVRERLGARRRVRVPVWTWAVAAALLLAVLTPLTLQRYAPRTRTVDQAPAAARPPAAPPATTAPTAMSKSVNGLGYVSSPPPAEVLTGGRAPGPATRAPGKAQPSAEPAPRRLLERDEDRRYAGRLDGFADKKEDADRRQRQAASPAPPPEQGREPELAAREEVQVAAAPESADASRGQPATPAPKGEDAGAAASNEAPLLRSRPAQPTPAAGSGGFREGKLGLQKDEEEFERLTRRAAVAPASPEEARALATAWREFARRHSGPQADEARVRAIEALAAAFRLGGRSADRDQARAEARAYLAGPAPQAARVRALLERLSR